MDVNKFLINADRFCDYIPVLSTLTNLVDMVITRLVFGGGNDTSSNPYFNYLKDKNKHAGYLAPLPFVALVLRPENPTDIKILNLSGLFFNKPEYEAKVDRFLDKLFESGYENHKREDLKKEILEENKLNLGSVLNHHSGLKVLPPEIGELTRLTELNLHAQNLEDLPPEIGRLTRLTKLDLGRNNLKVLSPEIGKLTSLTELDLSCLGLPVLSPEIGKLTRLTTLRLNDNCLKVLPPEIGKLTRLTCLYLYANELTVLPKEIGELTLLNELWLSDDKLIAESGDDASWGKKELVDCFGNKVKF